MILSNRSGFLFLAASLLFLALLAAMPLGLVKAQDSQTPADFELTLFSAPVMKGAVPGPYGVMVHRDNTATFYSITADGVKDIGKTVEMDPGAVDAIFRVVQEQDFFTLKPKYEDARVLDGDYAIITVTANGVTHAVETRNIALQPFDTIALWVNSYFEPEDMILYNAFLDDEMEEAAR